MDARRASRMVIDPKVRQVGFVTPGAPPERSQSTPVESISPPVSGTSPAGNSLSPVMIPPPRHLSDNFSSTVILNSSSSSSSSSRGVNINVSSMSPRRKVSVVVENMPLGSYNPSEMMMLSGTSPMASPLSKISDGEFSEDFSSLSPGRFNRRSSSGKVASSLPSGGISMTKMSSSKFPGPSNLTTVSMVKMASGVSENLGGLVEVQNERLAVSKPLKEKSSKAERRALQESQRAAKAAAKAERSTSASVSGGAAPSNAKSAKPLKPQSKKIDLAPVVSSEKKGNDRPPEKDRKKDVPHPRMQFDDEHRVEKAKRRAVVKQTEARNRVELFRHLPQYEHGTQLPDLGSKFFQLDPMHPSVYKVGLQYLTGDISGGNARCIAMLQAFREAVKDYSTPPEKALVRDLTAKISSYVSFLNECRPLSISMGNGIKFLKNRIAKIPLTHSESEAKEFVLSDIDRFINEKIILAEKVIIEHAVTKIRDGDVLLTCGSSSAVELILMYAHELGKQFRVVVVDSRPKLEGQALLRRLLARGLSCTYAHINAISYIMHEVTRVFLGASSVLSNGTIYSRVGTACVAMVAHAFQVPVLICCEAYKFHERVQLDSICSNELGDPEAISNIPGGKVNELEKFTNNGSLQFLNLIYDVTPPDYVSMIITNYGMIPPTSVPVIVREYRREHLLI